MKPKLAIKVSLSIHSQDSNTKSFKRTLIYFNTDTQYTQFRGKSPVSSHKTTLKQQINGPKRWKMKEKGLSCIGLVFTVCSVLGRLLAILEHGNSLASC